MNIESRLLADIVQYLKRDMEKFIKRQRRKEGVYGKNGAPSKGNKREAV